jgi:UDP-N-acetylglucosamine 2-epimerase (non-hydrolysing)/GDP/UDP-N,N'-diacetylbacillosamine 2-epimerase (hydrolysing)
LRKIVVVTGTRADYGIYYPVLRAIEAHPDLDLGLIVTCLHLSPVHGYTVKEIERDGFKIAAKVDMLIESDTGCGMAKSFGVGIMGIAQALESIRPDVILILGDRGEMLATAIAGCYMNIPVAHIHGGEVSGTVDEPMRHAITKLSHIHFPATERGKERIVKLGEDSEDIYVVGAPRLDTILNARFLSREDLSNKFSLDLNKPLLLVVQHPVTTEVDQAEEQMRETMESLVELKEQTVLIYPNADAGGRRMIKVIEEYRDHSFLRIFKSLPHIKYLSLMKVASVMIGNSSSGIIEAPSFHLPVVNIGTRQQGRERADNIIDVGYNKEEIIRALKKALYDEEFNSRVKNCTNPYGDGKAGPRIANILSEIEIDRNLLQKRLAY